MGGTTMEIWKWLWSVVQSIPAEIVGGVLTGAVINCMRLAYNGLRGAAGLVFGLLPQRDHANKLPNIDNHLLDRPVYSPIQLRRQTISYSNSGDDAGTIIIMFVIVSVVCTLVFNIFSKYRQEIVSGFRVVLLVISWFLVISLFKIAITKATSRTLLSTVAICTLSGMYLYYWITNYQVLISPIVNADGGHLFSTMFDVKSNFLFSVFGVVLFIFQLLVTAFSVIRCLLMSVYYYRRSSGSGKPVGPFFSATSAFDSIIWSCLYSTLLLVISWAAATGIINRLAPNLQNIIR
jgi:uncharacterized membrane protein